MGRKVGFREVSSAKERILEESGLRLKQGTAEAQLRARRPLRHTRGQTGIRCSAEEGAALLDQGAERLGRALEAALGTLDFKG